MSRPETLYEVNTIDKDKFLEQVYEARVAFIQNIIKNDPSQEKFEKGWMNRLNYMKLNTTIKSDMIGKDRMVDGIVNFPDATVSQMNTLKIKIVVL
jgi:hypothetical protein